jgi:hypothetical protein
MKKSMGAVLEAALPVAVEVNKRTLPTIEKRMEVVLEASPSVAVKVDAIINKKCIPPQAAMQKKQAQVKSEEEQGESVQNAVKSFHCSSSTVVPPEGWASAVNHLVLLIHNLWAIERRGVTEGNQVYKSMQERARILYNAWKLWMDLMVNNDNHPCILEWLLQEASVVVIDDVVMKRVEDDVFITHDVVMKREEDDVVMKRVEEEVVMKRVEDDVVMKRVEDDVVMKRVEDDVDAMLERHLKAPRLSAEEGEKLANQAPRLSAGEVNKVAPPEGWDKAVNHLGFCIQTMRVKQSARNPEYKDWQQRARLAYKSWKFWVDSLVSNKNHPIILKWVQEEKEPVKRVSWGVPLQHVREFSTVVEPVEVGPVLPASMIPKQPVFRNGPFQGYTAQLRPDGKEEEGRWLHDLEVAAKKHGVLAEATMAEMGSLGTSTQSMEGRMEKMNENIR